jgi:WD40 repeat protein
VTSVSQNPSASVDSDATSPWPGLESYTESSRRFFFGREKETEELVRLIRRNTLTVLFGQSGLGKSSLLQAGAFPVLREADYLPLYLRLDHALPSQNPQSAIRNPQSKDSLSDQVKSALVDAIKLVGADAPAPCADETLWEYFHRKDIDIWSAKNRLLTPVLAFDQFEEIFTLGRANEEQRERGRAFLTELADLVENRAPAELRAKFDAGELDIARYNFDKPSCQVVLSLREDFLPDLEGLKHEMRSILHSRMRVKRLNGTQALEIVTRPAPQLIADGVAERIVEFVAGARGGSAERLNELEVEPALLSVICRELNERRRALGQKEITADLVSGNRREILTDFYERSVADLPADMRAFVEDHLLTKSGFRDNLALETALEFPGVTRPLIDTLVSRRLLRIEDRLGVQRVELTHDVLAEVIRASRDMRQQRELLAGARRQTRRQRWMIAGLAAIIAGLCVGAFFGIRTQRQSAAQASETDFVLGSRLLDEGKLPEGLAYMARAGRKDPLNELVAPRLLSTLSLHNFALPVGQPMALPAPALGGAYSVDGRKIYVQTEDDALRSIDVATWQLEPAHDFGAKIIRNGILLAERAPVFAVQFTDHTIGIYRHLEKWVRVATISEENASRYVQLSPDGRWLAVRNSGGEEIRIWDTESGAQRAKIAASGVFQFSPNSRQIATYGGENRTYLWSVPDGKQVGEPIQQDREISRGRRFSADGKRLFIFYAAGLQAYDTETGEKHGPLLKATINALSSVTVSPDGSVIAIAGQERRVEVISVTTGSPAFAALEHGGVVIDATFSRDAPVLLTNSTDGFFRLWDMTTGRLLAEPMLKQDRYTPAIISPDGREVAVFTVAGPVIRVRVGRGAAEPLVLPRPAGSVILVNFHSAPPARLLWVMNDRAKAIDAVSGQEVAGGFSYPQPLTPWTTRSGVQISRSNNGPSLGPGEPMIARLGIDNFRVWTLRDDGSVSDIRLEDPPSLLETGFNLNPMGSVAAAGASPESVRVWNLKTGRVMNTITVARRIRGSGQGSVNSLRVSFDEKRIAIATFDNHIHVFDIESGTRLCELALTGRASLRGFIFTHDSAGLITGDNWGEVRHWEISSGKMLASYQAHRSEVTRFDFSNDNRYAMSLSSDGIVQMWDLTRGTPVGAPLSYSGRALIAAFSPDTTRVLTTSSDGTARISDIATGLPITAPLPHGRTNVTNSAFSPDGRFVTTRVQGAENASRLWSVPPPSRGVRTPEWLLRLASACAGQVLTEKGKTVPATAELTKLDELRREIDRLPENAPYAEWGRWLISENPTRSIAPGFTIKADEARNLAKEMAKPSAMNVRTP